MKLGPWGIRALGFALCLFVCQALSGQDTTSTITEPAPGPASLSSIAGLTDLFQLQVADLGPDAFATTVDAITFNVSVTGGSSTADFTWQLFNGTSTFSPSATTATTVSFSSAAMLVVLSGNGSLTLRAQVSSTSDTIDNQAIDIVVATADVTTAAGGSSLAAAQSVDNLTDTEVGVVATQIGMVAQPGASQSVGAGFACSLEYADAAGRRDTDIGDVISVARTDAGAITLPSPAQATCVSGLASFSMTLGTPGNGSGTLRLRFTDQVGGTVDFSVSPGPLDSSTFTLTAADDANSTIGEGTTGPATLPSTAGLTNIFNLVITDFGTSDTKATIVNGITFTITISGGSDDALDFAWELFNGTSTFSPSATSATSVSFSGGPLLSVANGGSGTLTLRAQVSTTSDSIDNKSIDVVVASAAVTTSASGTSLLPAQSVNNATNTAATVAATQIAMVSQPGASQSVGSSFACSLEYADASGRRDIDITDLIDVARSDAGSITLPSPAQASAAAGLASFSMTLGAPGNGSGTLSLRFTDQVSGSVNFSLSPGPLNSSTFTLAAANDANSTIAAGTALVEPTNISSMAPGFVNVLDFLMTDVGTSDGLPTVVTQIVVNVSGSGDPTEHAWRLNGPDAANVAGVVTATTITFSGLAISIANNSGETYTLSLDLAVAPTSTIDNENFVFSVSSTDLTTGAGTSFAVSGPVTNGAGLTYLVTATQIQVVQQPGATESIGVSFNVTCRFADLSGNRDVDVTDTISVARNDFGAITLPSPAQAAAVSGLATFAMTLGAPGNLSNTLRLTFTDQSGGSFDFSSSPKNTNTFNLSASNDANSTITEGTSGPATLPSTAALTNVFRLTIADAGTADGKATIVDGLTYTVTISGGVDDALDFNWQLFNGVANFAPTGVTATTVSFAASPLISVPNGGSGTLTLRAQVNASSATIDNKTIDLQVASAGVTTNGAGTSLSPAQTVNNSVDTAVSVAATELRFVGTPPSSAVVSSVINVQVQYTDLNGNRDLNIGGSDTITVDLTGTGTVSNGVLGATAGLCNFGAAGLSIGPPGIVAGTLSFNENGGGSVNLTTISVNPFDLVNGNDGNSTVSTGTVLTEPSTISSVAAGFNSVLDFRLTDLGTSDGVATTVTQIVVNLSGAANAADHTWRLNGPDAFNAGGVATSTTLTFSGLSISIANGSNETYTISLQLAPSPAGTTDNEVFVLSVSSTGLTTGAGTTFAASGPVDNGAGLSYSVAATRLTVQTPPAASQIEGSGFDVVVAYTDINGNVDINVVDQITGLTRSDAGSVQAPVLPLSPVNGVVNFTGANQVRLGLPAATNITLTFLDNAGGTVVSGSIITTSFNLIDATPPTVVSAVLRVAADPRGRTLRLTFNEPLRASSTFALTNYTLSFGGLHPVSTSLPTTSSIDLVFGDYAVAGADTLAITAIQDAASNPMLAVATQAIASPDAAAPTLVSITYNDSDGSSTPSPGDQYLFTFSEAMNDRVFSGATSANSILSAGGLSYGTPNNVSFGDDQGLATDSRVVIVTLVGGLTITGSEGIVFSPTLTDVSGNPVSASPLTLTVVDNISPRLLLTRLDDRDNNGNASLGDLLHVYFSESVNPATIPLINTAGQLNLELGLSGGTFGTDATAVLVAGNKEVLVTLGTNSPTIIGQTLNPPATVTDPAGNPDATSPAAALGTGVTDIFAPTFSISYSAANPAAVPAGNLRIIVTFTDTQTTTPTLAISQPGINDLPPTNMVSVAGSTRVWQYDWPVSFSDGTINIDGLNVLGVTGRPTDLRGNVLVPAGNNTFTTDTTTPIFGSVTISDPDNYYRAGDTISILASLGEPGLTVTANLSVVDSALGTQVAFTDNGNGTYGLTSSTLSVATLIEALNLPISVRARDTALNSSTFPVLVNIDNTPPSAALLYDQPSVAVGAGNLTITLSLSEPCPTVPTIAISGLVGTPAVLATAMTGSAGSSSFTFVLNVIAPTTGTATVTISNVTDLASNPPPSVANSSFTVDTQNTPLVANAGPDQNLTRPQQVALNASGSTGLGRTYAWTQDSGSPVVLSGVTTARPTFFVQSAGAYVFRVTVSSGASSADDTVTINLANSLPDVEAGERITLDRNDVSAGLAAVSLLGTALDVNGDTLFVQWTRKASPASGNLDVLTPTSLATPLAVVGGAPIVPGVYTFQLRVFDPIGLGASTPSLDHVDVVVVAPGTIPPSADAGPDFTANVTQLVTLSSLACSDSDGTIVAYQWRPISRPAGSLSLPNGAASAAASFTPDKAGIYVFGLRVTDDDNLTSAESTVSVIVNDLRQASINRVPRAVIQVNLADTSANGFANVGETFTLTSSGSVDADADVLTRDWRQTAGPEALRILDPRAVQINFAPTLPGVYRIALAISDPTSSGIAASVELVVAAAAATAPVAVVSLAATDDSNSDRRVQFIPGVGVENSAGNPTIDLDGTASTGLGATFQWRQLRGPTIALTSATAALASFVPALAGVYEFELRVTDSFGLASTKRLRLVVDTYDIAANPMGNAVAQANAGSDVTTLGNVVAVLTATATDSNTLAAGLKFHWLQIGGPPVSLDVSVPDKPQFSAPVTGVYVFELYVDDGFTYSLPDTVTVTHTAVAPSGSGSDGASCSTGESTRASLAWIGLFLAVLLARTVNLAWPSFRNRRR